MYISFFNYTDIYSTKNIFWRICFENCYFQGIDVTDSTELKSNPVFIMPVCKYGARLFEFFDALIKLIVIVAKSLFFCIEKILIDIGHHAHIELLFNFDLCDQFFVGLVCRFLRLLVEFYLISEGFVFFWCWVWVRP